MAAARRSKFLLRVFLRTEWPVSGEACQGFGALQCASCLQRCRGRQIISNASVDGPEVRHRRRWFVLSRIDDPGNGVRRCVHENAGDVLSFGESNQLGASVTRTDTRAFVVNATVTSEEIAAAPKIRAVESAESGLILDWP